MDSGLDPAKDTVCRPCLTNASPRFVVDSSACGHIQ